LSDAYQTLLFPRPRRFGKTTNLSMLGYFLGKSETDHSALFRDLANWNSAEAREHFQRYPLVSLTFNEVKQRSWAPCLDTVNDLPGDLFIEHSYLLKGGLQPSEAQAFQAILDGKASPVEYKRSLRKLSQYLRRHHGEKVVILLDEYDTPLHEAFVRGYYDE